MIQLTQEEYDELKSYKDKYENVYENIKILIESLEFGSPDFVCAYFIKAFEELLK